MPRACIQNRRRLSPAQRGFLTRLLAPFVYALSSSHTPLIFQPPIFVCRWDSVGVPFGSPPCVAVPFLPSYALASVTRLFSRGPSTLPDPVQ
ncbi:hypothetical protein BJ912DRAFT_956553 [Pholiota molesta]|nr:hypothetical protein BJ912DRAFT_956553 [Pholiota molesta]